MIQLISNQDLKQGYKGMKVQHNPVKKGRQTYQKEITMPKALVKQYIQYLEKLLQNKRIRGKEREELQEVVDQYQVDTTDILFLSGEAGFRLMSFMERIKGRYIEGLQGYMDKDAYIRIK